MIEKLAKVIHDECEGDDDSGGGAYMRAARAVLQALREPTFEMKLAGAEAITADTMKAMANYDGAIQCWTAMIDAALAAIRKEADDAE